MHELDFSKLEYNISDNFIYIPFNCIPQHGEISSNGDYIDEYAVYSPRTGTTVRYKLENVVSGELGYHLVYSSTESHFKLIICSIYEFSIQNLLKYIKKRKMYGMVKK